MAATAPVAVAQPDGAISKATERKVLQTRRRDRGGVCGRCDLWGPHFIVWPVIRFTFRSVCSTVSLPIRLSVSQSVSQFMQHRQGLERAKVFGRARSVTAAKLVDEIN